MRPCLQLRDVLMLFGLLPLVLSCGSSPAAPCLDQNGRGDTRFNEIKLSCVTTASQLQCQAVADIAGLYVYCPMSEDVTQAADWTVGDGSVVRTLMPGVFAAVATGHTFVHATWHGLDSNDFGRNPVAVFPGTAPLPTYEVFGTVSQAGQTPSASPISGAVIQVLDGLVAGQMATSGVPPALLPGYLGPFGGQGYYRILGVPPGTYHLRISKDGYASQDRTVTVSTGSPSADFQLLPM